MIALPIAFVYEPNITGEAQFCRRGKTVASSRLFGLSFLVYLEFAHFLDDVFLAGQIEGVWLLRQKSTQLFDAVK